jgi:hypothetical protein
MPCVYLPGPAPAVTVANTKNKSTLLKDDSHLGVHPGGVLDSLHAGLEESRLLTDPSLTSPPSSLLVYPASAEGSLEVVIARSEDSSADVGNADRPERLNCLLCEQQLQQLQPLGYRDQIL